MRVDFYHLQSSPLERALPVLLERVLQSGKHAVVMAASEDRIEAFYEEILGRRAAGTA